VVCYGGKIGAYNHPDLLWVVLISSGVRKIMLVKCYFLTPGGNVSEMLLFNDVISHIDLVEVSLKNRAFTLE
jgi:hypothetical protein